MKAVVFRVRSMLRRNLGATLGVTLIVTVVCGVVVAFAAGAQRTSTAPDRYTSAFGGVADASVIQDDRGKPLDRQVAALPGVEKVDSMSFVFGGLTKSDGTNVDFALTFSGSFRPAGVRLVDGREADPANAHEFVATRSFVQTANVKIGDSLNLVTLTPDQARQNGFDVSDPQGPELSIKMVGIVDGATELDNPYAIVFVSPALRELPVGLSQTLMVVDLQSGIDNSMLRSQLDAVPALSALSVEPATLISQPVRNAVQAQARGLWILAAVAAVAAIAVLGQVMTRQVRPTRDERHRLSAIGFTRSQIAADAVARALIPITIGSLLGALVAVLGSNRFPFGFVRVLEPTPGIRADWIIMLAGAVMFVVALTLWTITALVVVDRAKRVRPSPLVEALATRGASATAGVGLRLAFTRRGRERGSGRGSVAGVLFSVAGVVAAVTFGASLDRLVNQPSRYGSNYDASVGDNGAEALPDGMVARLDADPDVTSLTLFAGSEARVGDITIPLLGLEVVRGGGQPTMLDGRLPVSDDEIALGRLTARDIGANVGGTVELVGPTRSQVFRVTGLAVVPGLGANDGLGAGGIVTMDGLTRIDAKTGVTSAAVNLKISLQKFFGSIPEFRDLPPNPAYKPSAIVNVSRIRAIPFILAAVLAALALLTVGHVMLTSMRSRRRDLAILRSLGAGRSWISRAVHWQATALTALPVVVGIPLGIAMGRLVFVAFADSMGAVHDPSIPALAIAAGAVAVVAVANAVATMVSHRTRRREPALLLQGE